MSTFAASFWSADYAGGLGVAYAKLAQGVQENRQILEVVKLRAEADEIYAQRLGDIESATNRIDGGFQRDDGASVKKVSSELQTNVRAALLTPVLGIRRHPHGDDRSVAQPPQDLLQHPRACPKPVQPLVRSTCRQSAE